MQNTDILELESKGCFNFFWSEANTNPNSLGYGLIRDNTRDRNMASIASVGFGLTAIVIGVERGWITYEEGYKRVKGTLETLLNNVDQINGFFYHFIDINSGKRINNSEVSIIDTAILICGAVTAAEYFNGEIRHLFEKIYKRVDWEWYRNPDKNIFYMGYSPEMGHFGGWDLFAEQLMMYVLGVASPTHPVNSQMFYDFGRLKGKYGDLPEFIYTWTGSLFTHQFSHAWIDFRNTVDREGVDWFQNSVIATKSARQYCIDNPDNFKTFGENSWGLTACAGPNGYSGRYGSPPSGRDEPEHCNDGTVPPAGAAGSIVFTPKESIAALEYYYENFPQLWGEYGFYDAYNLDVEPAWFDDKVIGIDKGITLLMIENYRAELVWKLFMKNEYVQKGIKEIGITEKNKVN